MNLLGIDIGGTSIKAAMVRSGSPDRNRPAWTAASAAYARPDRDRLALTLRDLLLDFATAHHDPSVAVGLCLPGVFDPKARAITTSINMPALIGVNVDDLIREVLPAGLALDRPVMICSDALAAAVDFAAAHPTPGRLLAISLGTGVGAAVLDDGVPLLVSGHTPGHFGQIDVTVTDPHVAVPTGPDGSRGTLEAYIGLPALRERRGDVAGWLAALSGEEVELRALVRSLRIAHAIYRPERIALLGGVGLALRPVTEQLAEQVNHRLTSVARPGWSLVVGDHPHHAAAGAARLAGRA